MKHRRTDPACVHYRAPRTALGRWWHDYWRGFSCRYCLARRNHPSAKGKG